MMKTILYTLLFLNATFSFGQDSLLVNKKYLEDQIYVGINYNVLQNKPEFLQQKGISINYQLGFIKDLPLNKDGTIALGIGLGYAYNKFNQTLKIATSSPEFSVIIDENYKKNKFETNAIELPIEIRIRKSSPTVYKFWRVYAGGKIAYIFSSRSIYKNVDGSEIIKLAPIPYLNKWQYGPQISFGYGTWNIYTFFNLNELFSRAPVSDGVNVNQIKSFKIGLQFYIF